MNVGTQVKTKVAWPGVPEGTQGWIVQDYGTGVLVAWNLPDRPYPEDMTLEEVASMPAVNPLCPYRDGFDKETELHYLEEMREEGGGQNG